MVRATDAPSVRDSARKATEPALSGEYTSSQKNAVVCVRCESHLGHVFEDGTGRGGQYYRINPAALELKAA